MNSNTTNTHQGVQPLVADDAGSADIKSDEELMNGASEDDGPLHQAEEAAIRFPPVALVTAHTEFTSLAHSLSE